MIGVYPVNASLPASFYDRALAAVGQAVIATDLDGHVLYWNAAAEELYRYEASQVVGRLLADLIIPADGRGPACRPANPSPATARCATRTAGRSPSTRRRRRFLMAAGTVVAMLGVSYDVSARRLAEARARHLAAIVENSDDAIIEADPHGVIRTANAAIRASSGTSQRS
jgi:PAS domain-containing protein